MQIPIIWESVLWSHLKKMRKYYGEDAVCPVYVQVEDGERLSRALNREREQENPRYEEMCRRFIADQSDFSEENILNAGIEKRFSEYKS